MVSARATYRLRATVRAAMLANALVVSACTTNVGTLEVRLLRSPRTDQDPFTARLVTLLSLRVDGPNGRVGPHIVSVDDGPATLPDVPVGDGQVIEIQGFTGEGSLPTALARSTPMTIHSGVNTIELYFGAINRFSMTPASGTAEGMKTPRAYHTATALPSGAVVAIGGTDKEWRPSVTEVVPKGLNSTSLLDASSLRFLPVDCGTTAERCMLASRIGHTTTVLPSGNLLVAGGTVGGVGPQLPVDTTEVLLADTLSFAFSPNMLEPRLGHGAARQGDLALLIGGFTNPSVPDPTGAVDAFENGVFAEHSLLKQGRRDFAVTTLDDETVFICGGRDGQGSSLSSSELLSAGQGTWRRGPDLKLARAFPVATRLSDGRVLIVGGLNSAGDAVSSVELYDPTEGTIEDVAHLGLGRWGHTVSQLRDGRVLVVGGYGGGKNGAPSAQVEVLTPPGPNGVRWSRTNGDTLREPRAGHTATLLPNHMLVVIGGVTGDGHEVSARAEVFVN